MGVRHWLGGHLEAAKSDPARAALEATHAAYLGLWYTVTSRWPLGTNVFERDWDALVVLDACRTDAFRAVAPEYPFVGPSEPIWSRGSHSHEWMARTFTEPYREAIGETAYVNPNGYADLLFEDGVIPPKRPTPVDCSRNDVVTDEDFLLLDNVHDKVDDEEYDTYGTVPPRYITDRAIHVGRTLDPERLVVHYFQPHNPLIGRALREDREPGEVERHAYEYAEAGRLATGEVQELYLDNLRAALDEVALLRENLALESVAITADHGDWIGEFGRYGHPEGIVHPSVRRVPWARTTAADERTHEPDERHLQAVGERDVGDAKRRLADMGYKL